MTIRHEMITGRWSLLVEDSHADDDAYLDEVPLTGKVVFTPVWPEGVVAAPAGGDDEPLRLVAAQPVTALVADGILTDLQGREGQPLPVQIGGVELWWRARFTVHFHGIEVPMNPLLVDATDGPVELATLISAKGYPDDDLSGLEAIRATVQRQARDVADALDLVNRAAAGVEDLQRRSVEAIEQAEQFVKDAAAILDDTRTVRANTAEIRDEVHGWYEQLSTDTKLIIDAINGHVDAIAGDVAEDAARAEQAADRAGDAARVEVEKLKGDAPEAFDTLEEIAAWISDAQDAAGALVQKISEKADKEHRHEASEIDGLDEALGNVVRDDDDRLEDPRTPTAHEHSGDEVTVTVTVGTDDGDVSVDATVQDAVQGLTDDMAQSMPESRIQVVDDLPDSPTTGTIYLVRE